MILRGLASLVVIGLFALNAMLPTAPMTGRGTESRVRSDVETRIAIGRTLPPLELFDLASDPGEARDLAGARPEDAGRLRAKLDAWRESVGALMPVPNPEWTAPGDGGGD